MQAETILYAYIVCILLVYSMFLMDHIEFFSSFSHIVSRFPLPPSLDTNNLLGQMEMTELTFSTGTSQYNHIKHDIIGYGNLICCFLCICFRFDFNVQCAFQILYPQPTPITYFHPFYLKFVSNSTFSIECSHIWTTSYSVVFQSEFFIWPLGRSL